MMTPSADTARILFRGPIDIIELSRFHGALNYINEGGFAEIHWLNTPGPIYTVCTDNCGTGPDVAKNNVGFDEEYREVVFKQPFTSIELKDILTAASIDPFNDYYIDGNQQWTKELIIAWWLKSNERIDYILDRYHAEINGRGKWDATPESFRSWLNFYQHGMKEYLEWYILELGNQPTILPALVVDWTRKQQLDDLLRSS